MKFWDISLSLDKTTIAWPGDVRFSRQEKRGSGITSKLTMSTHTGTHIDAPKHFLFDKAGVDKIALSKLIGPCRVVEVKSGKLKAESLIEVGDVRKIGVKKGDKILFKTRNSKLLRLKKFTSDYVSLSLEAAEYLAAKKIDLVGIDYLGIEAKSPPVARLAPNSRGGAPGHPVHKALLAAGIVNVEGLDLSKVKPGSYNLAVLPLRITNADGSPARAILWK